MPVLIIVIPALLSLGSAIGWFYLRSNLLLAASIAFFVSLLATGISIWVLPYFASIPSPSAEDWQRAKLLGHVANYSSLIGAISFLLFGVGSKHYERKST